MGWIARQGDCSPEGIGLIHSSNSPSPPPPSDHPPGAGTPGPAPARPCLGQVDARAPNLTAQAAPPQQCRPPIAQPNAKRVSAKLSSTGSEECPRWTLRFQRGSPKPGLPAFRQPEKGGC